MASTDYTLLSTLPRDKGGTHTQVKYDSSKTEYGYYVYLPSDYHFQKTIYPLLVFLHGAGERGNSQKNPEDLRKILSNGPPMLIDKKRWDPPHPMIVVSPQCHEGSWNAQKLQNFFHYLVNKYRVNKKRFYLSGLSMGGFGIFSYLQLYSDSGYVAASVCICSGGNPIYAHKLLPIPIWAFHGDADPIVRVSRSKDIIKSINALNPPVKAKLTIYPDLGHDSWTRTFDGTGMGTEDQNYDPFDESIYEWMFRYSK